MWIVAGILLALVVLGIAAGFHLGPHAHIPAAVAGVLAAAWLIAMLLLGDTRPILFVLLGADVSITSVLGFGAIKVLRDPRTMAEHDKPVGNSEGAFGTAVTDIDNEGMVSIRGEQWSATSLNGHIAAGSRVQVIRARGLRLEVWGESSEALLAGEPETVADFSLPDEGPIAPNPVTDTQTLTTEEAHP